MDQEHQISTCQFENMDHRLALITSEAVVMVTGSLIFIGISPMNLLVITMIVESSNQISMTSHFYLLPFVDTETVIFCEHCAVILNDEVSILVKIN